MFREIQALNMMLFTFLFLLYVFSHKKQLKSRQKRGWGTANVNIQSALPVIFTMNRWIDWLLSLQRVQSDVFKSLLLSNRQPKNPKDSSFTDIYDKEKQQILPFQEARTSNSCFKKAGKDQLINIFFNQLTDCSTSRFSSWFLLTSCRSRLSNDAVQRHDA